MKCWVSTDVGTWRNWLTFEPDPDYSPDAGTGLLSPISYKRCYAEFYVRKIPRIRIGGPPLQQGIVLKWFYSPSRRNTFVGGTCALPSALLVHHYLLTGSATMSVVVTKLSHVPQSPRKNYGNRYNTIFQSGCCSQSISNSINWSIHKSINVQFVQK